MRGRRDRGTVRGSFLDRRALEDLVDDVTHAPTRPRTVAITSLRLHFLPSDSEIPCAQEGGAATLIPNPFQHGIVVRVDVVAQAWRLA